MKEKRGRKRRELRRTRASLGGERKELRKMKRTTKQSEETSQKKTQKQKKKNKASEVIETVQPERKKGKRQEEIYTKQKMASISYKVRFRTASFALIVTLFLPYIIMKDNIKSFFVNPIPESFFQVLIFGK